MCQAKMKNFAPFLSFLEKNDFLKTASRKCEMLFSKKFTWWQEKMSSVDDENLIKIAIHNFEKNEVKVFEELRWRPIVNMVTNFHWERSRL